MHFRKLLLPPILLLLAAPIHAQSNGRCELIATNWGSPTASLWDIDVVTGAASNQRNGSFSEQAVGLTRQGNGAFYGLGIGGTLYTIDPVTAAVTPIGLLGIFPPEGGIDFDPTTGLLYGINSTTGSVRGLYSIDPGTAAATDIGDVQFGDLSAIAFDDSGTLWILDTTNDELLTVDPGTGSVLTSVDVSHDFDFIAGMDFDPQSGVLYVGEGGSNSPYGLYTLNTTTGVATLIGVTGLDSYTAGISGLEFNCPPPPVAALGAPLRGVLAVGLLTSGIAFAAIGRRRTRARSTGSREAAGDFGRPAGDDPLRMI